MISPIGSSLGWGSNLYVTAGLFVSTFIFNRFLGTPYAPDFASPNFPQKLTPTIPGPTVIKTSEIFDQVYGPTIINPEIRIPTDFEPSLEKPMISEPALKVPEPDVFDVLNGFFSGGSVLNSPTVKTIQDISGIAFGFGLLGILYYMTRKESKTDYFLYKIVHKKPLEENKREENLSNSLRNLELALAKFR